MRFLIDADLPRSSKVLIESHGHEAIDVRDVGMRKADDAIIAAYAQANQLCIVSGDFGFADIRNYPPDKYQGIVVVEAPRDATSATMLNILQGLLARPDILPKLPGRVAIVSLARIRLRPSG